MPPPRRLSGVESRVLSTARQEAGGQEVVLEDPGHDGRSRGVQVVRVAEEALRARDLGDLLREVDQRTPIACGEVPDRPVVLGPQQHQEVNVCRVVGEQDARGWLRSAETTS